MCSELTVYFLMFACFRAGCAGVVVSTGGDCGRRGCVGRVVWVRGTMPFYALAELCGCVETCPSMDALAELCECVETCPSKFNRCFAITRVVYFKLSFEIVFEDLRLYFCSKRLFNS